MKKKRRAGPSLKERASKSQRTQLSAENWSSLHTLLDTLEKTADTDNKGVWMALELSLNKCTFEKSLHSMFADEQVKTGMPQHVPVVSRQYEESFMHEFNPDTEQPCVMGKQCECMFIDKTKPFIAPQFILPDIQCKSNGFCVLCLRKCTQLLFYRLVRLAHQHSVLIQTYGNISNQPGEYHPSAMLTPPPDSPVHCMPLPIVAHQRNRYYVEEVDGRRVMRQRNVFFEDF